MGAANWFVMGSTATTNAVDNAVITGPVINISNQGIIAIDADDLWDLDFTESGAPKTLSGENKNVHFGTLGGGLVHVGNELGADNGSVRIAWSGWTDWSQAWRAELTSGEKPLVAISEELRVGGPQDDFQLVIRPSSATPGNFDFEWESNFGRLYDLVSNPDLATPPESWEPWDPDGAGGNPPYSDIPADEGVTTTLTDIPGRTVSLGGEPRRFFAVVEKDLPPLLSENFDSAAAIPADWSATSNGAGTVWQVNDPSSGPPEGPDAAASGSYCAGTNITASYTTSAIASLTTPVIAIPANGAILVFQYYIDTDMLGDVGSVRLLDADNGDAEIIDGSFPVTSIEGIASGWTTRFVSIPDVALNKNVKIRFQFDSNDDFGVYTGFYVDDVEVNAN